MVVAQLVEWSLPKIENQWFESSPSKFTCTITYITLTVEKTVKKVQTLPQAWVLPVAVVRLHDGDLLAVG